MSAWSVLVGNSTLPDNGINTSWLHLNNQDGGGGGAPYPVYLTHANDAESNTITSADAFTEAVAAATTETEAQAASEVLTATATNITSAET